MCVCSFLSSIAAKTEKEKVFFMNPLLFTSLCTAAMSLLAFCAMGLDKRLAIRGGQRISENALLLLAGLLGGPGAFLGMRVFRHKTKHRRFMILLPVFSILQLLLLALLVIKVSGT